jgi:formylglycine-generating enzyme
MRITCFILLCVCFARVQAQQTVTNSIGMKFVRIPAGGFTVGEFKPPYPVSSGKTDTLKMTMWMGDPSARPYSSTELEKARQLALADYSEGFTVTISKSYYLAQFEVTQDQWIKVMGSNPSTFQHDSIDKTIYPLESVSWKQAKEFISKLNALEHTKKYRLPSEFEWEYAARAGRTKEIPWNETQLEAQLGGKKTYPVGRKQANAFGVYDMLGNVWEWVEDCYNEKIFADRFPQKKCEQHVLKGASFAGDVKNATYMTHAAGPANDWDVGFRVLMEIE